MNKKFDKSRVIFIISISIIFLFIGVLTLIIRDNNDSNELIQNPNNIKQINKYNDIKWIKIEVVGNIKVPGIYEIPDNINKLALIKFADGFKKINLDFILNILDYIKINKNKVFILYKE